MDKMYYTGVGSRKTPKEMCDLMTKIASVLEDKGYTLRSGAATGGSDPAFEKGVRKLDNKEIYIPWKNFGYGVSLDELIPEKVLTAMETVSVIHPNPKALTNGALLLHTRNVFQVLGKNLNQKSKFLICWSEVDQEGIPKGGTRTAWQVAKFHNIPCFNLNIKADFDRVVKLIEK